MQKFTAEPWKGAIMKYYQIRMYLVNARQKLGYSQYRVASEMGVCHQHYNRIENGVIGKDIQFRTIYALSVVLEIPFNVICEKEVEYQRILVSGDDD